MASQTSDLFEFLAGKRMAVLTGAGCSTPSGIPDYGGLHSQTRKTRITYSEFVGDESNRKRYWGRATVGWRRIGAARPNAAHDAIAHLESAGLTAGVITQNVDGLHSQAGNQAVVELHGNLSRVVCLHCGGRSSREAMNQRLIDANPWLREARAPQGPDGDAELFNDRVIELDVPACRLCGGMLKPDVVFFGESVPSERVEAAWDLYSRADVLLVAGSSLAVFSGFRFALRAARDGLPLVILNRGPTRADDRATMIVDCSLEEVLPRLARCLGAAA